MSNSLIDQRSYADVIPTGSLDAAPNVAPPLDRIRDSRASARMAILIELGGGGLLLEIAALAGSCSSVVHGPIDSTPGVTGPFRPI